MVLITGLRRSDNGCSCHYHNPCGQLVEVGCLVRFMYTIIAGRNGAEEAIASVAVRHGQESCRVGFLPHECLSSQERYIDKFAQVDELYHDHEDAEKRSLDNVLCGAAECVLLDDIPPFE